MKRRTPDCSGPHGERKGVGSKTFRIDLLAFMDHLQHPEKCKKRVAHEASGPFVCVCAQPFECGCGRKGVPCRQAAMSPSGARPMRVWPGAFPHFERASGSILSFREGTRCRMHRLRRFRASPRFSRPLLEQAKNAAQAMSLFLLPLPNVLLRNILNLDRHRHFITFMTSAMAGIITRCYCWHCFGIDHM